jgi:hypothetical protein
MPMPQLSMIVRDVMARRLSEHPFAWYIVFIPGLPGTSARVLARSKEDALELGRQELLAGQIDVLNVEEIK